MEGGTERGPVNWGLPTLHTLGPEGFIIQGVGDHSLSSPELPLALPSWAMTNLAQPLPGPPLPTGTQDA